MTIDSQTFNEIYFLQLELEIIVIIIIIIIITQVLFLQTSLFTPFTSGGKNITFSYAVRSSRFLLHVLLDFLFMSWGCLMLMPSTFQSFMSWTFFFVWCQVLKKIICKALQAIQVRIIVMCVFHLFSVSVCFIIIGTAHVKEEDVAESFLDVLHFHESPESWTLFDLFFGFLWMEDRRRNPVFF